MSKRTYLLTLIVLFPLLMLASTDINPNNMEVRKDSKTNKYGYVNESDSCRSPWYERAHRVSFGILGIGGGTKKEMLNHGYDDEWVISAQYEDAAKHFSEKLAAVQIGGKVGFIDSLNRFIIEPEFETTKTLEGFSQGLAAVKKNGKYGFIDKKGNFVIEPTFEYAENFKDCKLATVKQDGKFGAIDLNGEIVVECKYPLEEAMISVPISNKPYRQARDQVVNDMAQGKYEKSLNMIGKAAEEIELILSDPNATLKSTRKVDIRKEGEGFGAWTDTTCLVAPMCENIKRMGDNLLFIRRDGKWGACDVYGRTILPAKYDDMAYIANARLLAVSDNGKIGLYSPAGRMLLPPCLDGLGSFVAGKGTATINGEVGLIDGNGELSDDLMLRAFAKVAKMDDSGANNSDVWPLYNQLLLARPDYAMVHNNIGIMEIEREEYHDGMNRLKVAHKLEPDNEQITGNLKQAKKDRNQRRWNRIGKALEVAGAVVTVAAVTYNSVETVKHGDAANTLDLGGLGLVGSDAGNYGTFTTSGGSDVASLRNDIANINNRIASLKQREEQLAKEKLDGKFKSKSHSYTPTTMPRATSSRDASRNFSKSRMRNRAQINARSQNGSNSNMTKTSRELDEVQQEILALVRQRSDIEMQIARIEGTADQLEAEREANRKAARERNKQLAEERKQKRKELRQKMAASSPTARRAEDLARDNNVSIETNTIDWINTYGVEGTADIYDRNKQLIEDYQRKREGK